VRRDGLVVNSKRVKRLMRVVGIKANYQKPNTSVGHPAHKVYPHPLRGLLIDRLNQVWCADITSVPMAKGFVYLVAVGAADAFRHIDPLRGPMDWFSRQVLSWQVSISMDSDSAWRCCARPRTSRAARDFQHRSGGSVHQRGFFGWTGSPGGADQHGRVCADSPLVRQAPTNVGRKAGVDPNVGRTFNEAAALQLREG
jgi:hypothetical protein